MIDFILRPFRRNFGRNKRYYRMIDDMFGFIPHNIELYKLALIHKSASVALPDGEHINNERLEYLGDAIIEAITSDYIFIEFPHKQEGFMTQLRSKIVSRQSLNDIARKIGLDECIICNTSNNALQKNIYGDAFEAMLGAIYLDQGYEFANRLLINGIYYRYLSLDDLTEAETDFKSRLIEWAQKHHHTVEFRSKQEQTVRGMTKFTSVVLLDGLETGHGVGASKKEAEQNAAHSMSTQNITDEMSANILDKYDRLSGADEKSDR